MSKTISIITPCRNAEKYIQETILSVINQDAIRSGRAKLQYIICDGKSTDKTLEVIDQFKFDCINFISEEDSGMYDALSKGLFRASGDIISYINAGDVYHPHAFDVVLDIFEQYPINWLTGYTTRASEKGYVIPSLLPYKYRRRFFKCGMYNGVLLPFVQQESTFWSSSLHHHLDLDRLSEFKLCGDFYIWHEFSKFDSLHIVDAYLSSFRVHRGQLSEQTDKYLQEIRRTCVQPNLVDYFVSLLDKAIWIMPSSVKKRMNPSGIFRFNHGLQMWY